MSSALRKISINELKVGMFVVEMDISWIKSPFLLHRRAIKSENDVILLKKSGAKVLTIDLDKSHVEADANAPERVEAEPMESESTSGHDVVKTETRLSREIDPQCLNTPSASLKDELIRAVVLKQEALDTFKEINTIVSNNQPIPVKEIEPVIDETINSLLRNSQALLTLMHLKRYEEKLFSHSFSVMTLALTFAIKDNVSQEDLETLGLAALLHDIGWAQLPLNLFGKARTYSENEQTVVQQHQRIAAIVIKRSKNFPESVKRIMMNHHERIDGSGYPDKLKAEQLDHLSKILIVTDYYDELVHGLTDRPGLIPAEALRFLYKEAVDNKLEKSQVELLIKLLGIYPLTSAVELTSGEKGVVIEINRDKPLVPVVKIMYTSDGNALASPVVVDLVKDDKKRQIKGIVDLSKDKTDPKNLLIVEDIS